MLPHPTRRIGQPARGIALAAAGSVIGGTVVLVAEALAARSGGSSPQPPGSPDALVGAGEGPSLHLVVLGDSTGVAVGAGDMALGYPRRVAEALAAHAGCRVELRVLAVSGARVADVLADQVPRLAGHRPHLVLLAIGGNDVTHLTRGRAARADLRAILGAASATGAAVVVAGIPAMGTIRRLRQPLRAVTGVVAGRYDTIWRDETERAGAARVELAAFTERPFREDPTLLSGDGFHPSAAGYAVWTEAIAPVVISVAPTSTL